MRIFIFITVLILFSCNVIAKEKACTPQDAYNVFFDVNEFSTYMRGLKTFSIGYCDINDFNSPCCIDFVFDKQEDLAPFKQLFYSDFRLFGFQVRGSLKLQ